MAETSVTLDFASVPRGRLYDLLASAIQPRPIALVSTVSADGVRNLAPFSFFNLGGINPPCVVFCPSNKSDGTEKDSLRNCRAMGEFVVNLVHREIVPAMNQAGVDVAAHIEEWPLTALTPLVSDLVQPQRVAESPVQLECRVVEIVSPGLGPNGTHFVIGEILRAHVHESLWQGGEFRPADFRMVGRMGGAEYIDAATGEIFELKRPSPV